MYLCTCIFFSSFTIFSCIFSIRGPYPLTVVDTLLAAYLSFYLAKHELEGIKCRTVYLRYIISWLHLRSEILDPDIYACLLSQCLTTYPGWHQKGARTYQRVKVISLALDIHILFGCNV